MAKFTMDRQKFKELILYISERCETQVRFGAIKLNKILYFSDVRCFAQTGTPITGARYFKLPKGPAPRALVPVTAEMEARQELKLRTVGSMKKTFALRPADLSKFSGTEIAIVDRVIEELWDMDADAVSDASHGPGWWWAADQQDIPYESVFFNNAPLSDIQKARGRQIARRFAGDIATAAD